MAAAHEQQSPAPRAAGEQQSPAPARAAGEHESSASARAAREHERPAPARAAAVHVRRLTPADADALARLEVETYPESLRAGRASLRGDLREAAWDDSNLGFGLFADDELVGMFLVYYEADCRNLFDYFGMARPADMQAEECAYVADFVVRREYSRYTARLLKEAWANNPGYHGLPVLGFSTAHALDRWQARRRAFRRFGYEYAGTQRFELPGPPHEIFLVRFEVRHAPRYGLEHGEGLHVEVIGSEAAWRRLEPHWDALLVETPDATAFQSLLVQRLWWRHYARDSRLFILVAREGERIRAIAPFRIAVTTYLSRPRRLLTFIGAPAQIDRPTILRRGEDREAVAAIFGCALERRDVWDALMLFEQPRDGLVLRLAKPLLERHGLLVATVAGPACPWVDLTGSWREFLAAKPRSFRKGLRRKQRRLERLGAVEYQTIERGPGIEWAYQAYLDVEARSWKPRERLGVATDQDSLAYHEALVSELGPLGKLHFRVLSLDGRPIAATFGILEHGRFLSLHIAHDEAYSACSPGVLLTAYELEEAHGRADYEASELLGGFLNNKLSWTPHVRETGQLYAYAREPVHRVHYAWHFVVEPRLKAVLKRAGLYPAALAVKNAVRALLARRRTGGQRTRQQHTGERRTGEQRTREQCTGGQRPGGQR